MDALGNPEDYYNGAYYEFTWEGRRLASAVYNDQTFSFTYNDEGIRTGKTVDGVKHTYILEGSRIAAELWGANILVYIYDATGSPIGMQYRNTASTSANWETYWYDKNSQGDIVAVYSDAGVKLIEYTYDAWGNHTTTYWNGGGNTAAQYNPFRYRSYYFDEDLGLYYLNSRYYDQTIGRFISADTTDILTVTPMGLTDKNLFAYCDNNPVMRVDNGGEFWNFIIGGAVGAIVGAVVATLNGEDAAGIIISAVTGAASGVVAATGLGIVAQASISAGISAVGDFANQTVDILENGGNIIEEYNIAQTLDESALGFVTSVSGSLLGKIVDTKITKNLDKSNKLFDNYLGKTFQVGLRKECGKSTSALLRQANKFLCKSNFYLNAYQGVSSAIGSGVSLWNIVR